MDLLSLALLVLPALASAVCPTGCQCLPDGSDVKCTNGAVTRIPVIGTATTSLDLSNSRFTSPTLEATNFTAIVNIEQLTLRGCGISGIEYHAFAGMTRLKMLDLSFNNLMVIPTGALTGLKLDYLYMDNNPTISLLDSTFLGMTTELLSLKKCKIIDARPSIFKPLLIGPRKLRKIFLEENKIERFSQDMLEVFTAVEVARIHDNPLICDCESKWLKEFYDLNKDTTKIRDSRYGTTQEPRCVAPSHVEGQFFNRISVADFSCDKPTLHAGISFTNEKGILSCVSRGNPLPTVAWHRPNGVVSRSLPQGNMASNTNQIELLANEPNVQGQYRCVAANDGGNISLTVNVDWPFQSSSNSGSKSNCKPVVGETTPKEVDLTNSGTEKSHTQEDVFQIKYFTLVDIIGAILGTFLCTLIVTIVTLHFCVYRRKKAKPYTTPAMSEYSSSSNGSDKNGQYPISLHSLQTSQIQSQRPLPSKPYHKIYDENHYMATNIEERDEFLRHSAQHAAGNGRITPASSCDTCPACRTMTHHAPIS